MIYSKYITTQSGNNRKRGKKILYRIRVVNNIKKIIIISFGGKQKKKKGCCTIIVYSIEREYNYIRIYYIEEKRNHI